ncbi:hypothetical protein PENFLA_c128G00503 [Penicillium flavigenum]|uniref:Uncharacterized protein n=1 Tax=Penicillium flavigenum TaxID=254877 RepID=A0A1V6S3T8_9EURO|nr:hypothetical protein PENFLA_c128G00503 [Penicillium flavigenum]
MLVRFVKLISGVVTVSKHIWLSMARLFRPLGAGVRDSAGVACEKMLFSFPGALAVSLAGIGVLVSICFRIAFVKYNVLGPSSLRGFAIVGLCHPSEESLASRYNRR